MFSYKPDQITLKAAPSVSLTTHSLLTLHPNNFFDWNQDFRTKVQPFGRPGKELYDNKEYPLEEPMETTHVLKKIRNSETGTIEEILEPWAKSKKTNKATLSQAVIQYKKDKELYTHQKAVLFSHLANCMSPELRRKVRLHTARYREAEINSDHLGLFRLMMECCESFTTNNVATLVAKFQACIYDPYEMMLGDYIAKIEELHEMLRVAGKEPTDVDKVVHLSTNLKPYAISTAIDMILTPATTTMPDDPTFPLYGTLRKQLVTASERDPKVDSLVGTKGKNKRKADQIEVDWQNTDGPQSQNEFKRQVKEIREIAREEAQRVLAVSLHQAPAAGGGQDGGGGKRDNREKNRGAGGRGDRDGAARGGRDGRGRGGRGRGSGHGDRSTTDFLKCCWICMSVYHRASGCEKTAECETCKGNHLSEAHDVVVKVTGSGSKSSNPRANAVKQNQSDMLRQEFAGDSSEGEDGNASIRMVRGGPVIAGGDLDLATVEQTQGIITDTAAENAEPRQIIVYNGPMLLKLADSLDGAGACNRTTEVTDDGALTTYSGGGLIFGRNLFHRDFQVEWEPSRRERVPIPIRDKQCYEEIRDHMLRQPMAPAGVGVFAFMGPMSVLSALRYLHDDLNVNYIHDIPRLDSIRTEHRGIFAEFYARFWADGKRVSLEEARLVEPSRLEQYYYSCPIHAVPWAGYRKLLMIQRIPLGEDGLPVHGGRFCMPYGTDAEDAEGEPVETVPPHELDDYEKAMKLRAAAGQRAQRSSQSSSDEMFKRSEDDLPTFMLPLPRHEVPPRAFVDYETWRCATLEGRLVNLPVPDHIHLRTCRRRTVQPDHPEPEDLEDIEEEDRAIQPEVYGDSAVSVVNAYFERALLTASRVRRQRLAPDVADQPEPEPDPPQDGDGGATGHKRRRDEDDDADADGSPSHRLLPNANVNTITVSHARQAALAVKKSTRSADMVLIDSGSSYHIEPTCGANSDHFEKNEGHVHLTVANGEELRVTHVAKIPKLGLTVVAPDSETPIASAHQLSLQGCCIAINHNGFRGQRVNDRPAEIEIRHPRKSKRVYGYVTRVGHYMVTRADYLSLAEYDLPPTNRDYLDGSTLAATAGETGQYYTADDQVRAYETFLLHCARGHPSKQALILALTNGTIIGTHLTARDVHLMYAILGQCRFCQAGKTVKPSYRTNRDEPASAVGQVLHADIFPLTSETGDNVYGGGDVALLVVDEYSGYLTLVIMDDKSTAQLVKAFNTVLAAYAQFLHVTEEIHTDSESNLKNCHQHLNYLGIRHEASPPYQHSQRVERHTRTLRQRMSCMRATAPIVLAPKLEGELAKAAARYINDFPTTKHPTQSPRMLMEGKRLTLDKHDKLIPFGTVAQVLDREDKDVRAHTAIVLGPAPMTRHAFNCYVPSTGKVVVRACNDIDVMTKIPDTFPGEVKKEIRNKPAAMDEASLKELRKSAVKIPAVPLQIQRTITRTTEPATPTPPPEQRTTRITRSSTSSAREGEMSTPGLAASGAEPESAAPSGEPQEENLDDDEYFGTEETEARKAAEAGEKKKKRTEEVEAERARNVEKLREKLRERHRKQQLLDRAPVVQAKQAKKKLTALVALTRTEKRLLRRHWNNADKRLTLLTAMACRISVKEALGGEHAQESAEAIREEIQNMLCAGTFSLEDQRRG